MGASFSVKANAFGIERLTRKLDFAAKNSRSVIANVLRSESRGLIAELKKKYMSGRPGVYRRTGALQKSLKANVQISTGEVSLTIGSNSIYFNLQKYGGVVTPKVAQYMAIPTNYGLTARGLKRFPGGPGGYPGQFGVRRSQDGRLFLFLFQKMAGNTTHRLVKSAYIPPRLTWDAAVLRYLQRTTFPKIREKMVDLLA
jgi:hypothetical protein